ncbi:FtsB family cell division protein [Enterococcus sp. AZ109]|uniref:FtsB family cell division protein n=1 Tax=Enterococcus sp. AZ109 TaxID=2774634 RepID=UPI003F280FC4
MAEKKLKVATLGTPYAKDQYKKFQKQQRQLIFKRRRLTALFLIAAFVFTIMGVQLFGEHQHLNELKAIQTKTETESTKLDQRVKALKSDVALLQDEEYVAKLARSRYYYSKDGELVFVLPDQEQTSQKTASDEIVKSETAE